MKHYISSIAEPMVLCPESAVLTASEIPVSDDKTHHYDAPERMHGDWTYEWGDTPATK